MVDDPGQHIHNAALERIRVHDTRDFRELMTGLRQGAYPMGVLAFGPGAEVLWEMLLEEHVFVQAAGGAVVDEAGRLLAIKRLGKWDLPKGKVDRDEAIDAAAVREVREECGLTDVRILQPFQCTWHTYERKGKQHLKRTDWYLMQGTSTEVLVPQHEEDIEEVRWMDRADVERMKADTYPSLLPVIAAWEAWSHRA